LIGAEKMSEKTGRVEGKLEEIGGNIKKTVGHVIGNERLEVTGRAEELTGQVHQERAKASERTKGTIEEVAGSVKRQLGHLIDNEQMEAEGNIKEVTGQARQELNKK
jgi:uncharacterized protein YjbJ (UPF0337 family)